MDEVDTSTHPVVLFDGVCNLCTGYVQFIIRRDPDSRFRFAPLQSAIGRELVATCGRDPNSLDSIVLVDDGECHVKSDAVIRIAAGLGGIYHLARPFGILPRRFRDFWYDFVANRRYGWFGQKDHCMMPTPDIEARFLEGSATGVDTDE